MKKCPKCQLEKDPETQFAKDRTRKGGFSNWCKQCLREYQQKTRSKALERERARNLQNKESHDAYLKEYRETHKKERQVYMKEHYRKNAQTYKDNWKRFCELHPEYPAEYYQKHPEAYSEGYHRWKARKIENGHVSYKRQEVYRRDQGLCQLCGEGPLDYVGGWHLDHILPLFQGGPDTFENVRVTCPQCNLRRSRNET